MGKGRFEAFSDGVLAIIITIMVLELKVPHSESLDAIKPLLPVFLSYVLSFIYVAIYWNNHHHMLHTVRTVDGRILWANMHLLFWLSLMPFATAWMDENHFATLPTALYGGVLLMCGIAYLILQRSIVHQQGADSLLARAVGEDWKGKLSAVLYLTGMVVALWKPIAAVAVFVGVAVMWLVPDRRIERALAEADRAGDGG